MSSYSLAKERDTATAHRPPRPSSAYRRTFDSQQSHAVDLDTFDVPSPPSRLSWTSYSSFSSADIKPRRPTNSDTIPDLGEVDLADGKNCERPQRFKAIIHFKRRDKRSSKDGYDNNHDNDESRSDSPASFSRS